MTNATPNGLVIYRGPSMLDGAPIVVIATGLGKASTNGKTGDLVQTWILREDISPAEAVNTGADSSICGTCPHRGTIEDGKNVGRSCYVTIFQAPRNVWETYHKGRYPDASGDMMAVRKAFAGKRIRLGAYGDPAAVPLNVWERALWDAAAFTGYTHQWRDCSLGFARLVMASCDNAQDYLDAKAKGYRTFRVRAAGEALNAREVICPASKEAGVKTNCAACVACGGHGAKAKVDIAIIAHGAASKVNAFNARLAA
jgi:hypothetical protein